MFFLGFFCLYQLSKVSVLAYEQLYLRNSIIKDEISQLILRVF